MTSFVTKSNLDGIIEDRQRIIRAWIERNCFPGALPSSTRAMLDGLVRIVFYEPGWDTHVAEQVNGKPEFYVITFDPEAR